MKLKNKKLGKRVAVNMAIYPDLRDLLHEKAKSNNVSTSQFLNNILVDYFGNEFTDRVELGKYSMVEEYGTFDKNEFGELDDISSIKAAKLLGVSNAEFKALNMPFRRRSNGYKYYSMKEVLAYKKPANKPVAEDFVLF